MLRRRAAWRFATACTAHHGSFLPCSPVPLRCQRRCAGVCRPKEATPAAPPNTCCSRPPSRCDFPSHRVPTILLLHTRALVGRRLSATVGLAAFSSTYSSSPPERSPLRAALRSQRARHQPRAPSALVGPPWLSCQRALPLHSRRVCFAVAQLGASPLLARLGTAHSCRAWPCGGHCQRHCSECVPTEKLPPRPPRPTLAAADRPLAAIFHHVVC
jgi:hypothetical protein